MAIGNIQFVNGGELRLRNNAGLQWDESTHYAVLTKHAHVPSVTHDAFSDLTNICDSANYAHQNIPSKAFASGNPDSAAIDFTDSGADEMTARHLWIIEGVAASPNAGDVVIGYIDLTGIAGDGIINAAIDIDVVGYIDYVVV